MESSRSPDTRPIAERARFDGIRYANCWEDADVLVEGLTPLEGARCLSIASAGDNTLSLLAEGATSVVAVDLSPAQLALVELKVAAFRRLAHAEILGLLGVRPRGDRRALYRELRPWLDASTRAFWDARGALVARGVLHAGRLERYFRAFRRFVLPLIHGRRRVVELLSPRPRAGRERFFAEVWDTWRWRALVRLFFGRGVMGRLGRDPEFFAHAEGSVAERVLERARHALTALPTHDNPYLRYILTGDFGPRLPHYLRPEHHEAIRAGLDRVCVRRGAVEEVVGSLEPASIDVFSLSDVAEYMSVPQYHRLLLELGFAAAPGARLAYWNLFAPRRRPDSMSAWLDSREPRGEELRDEARAFFYGAFVLEVMR